MTFVVVLGDPIDGLRFVGPFEDADDAMKWAEEESGATESWWVADMEMPA